MLTKLRSTLGAWRGGLAAAALAALLPWTTLAGPALAEEVRIVMPAEPPDLDPNNSEFRYTGQIARHNVVESLTVYDQRSQEVLPRLATEWERTGDLTWRFTLRDGVSFHDGAPFNADAVVRSVERLFSEDLPSATRDRFFEELGLTATKVDERTVEFAVDRPEPLFLQKIAQLPIVSPNMPMDELSRAPVGTGPFASSSGTRASRSCSSATRTTGARRPRSRAPSSCGARSPRCGPAWSRWATPT